MGSGMAANLAKAGHDVRAFDLSAEALERAKKAGCLPVGSTAAAVEKAEAVVTMLPAGKHVRDVYENHILGKAPATAILMDCSTIDVATRSEEHTSELQSLMRISYAVFCLKKKHRHTPPATTSSSKSK